MLVAKDTYVRIRKHVLMPGERSVNLPKETSLVPLKMWVKGRLTEEAELFEDVTIITNTGRQIRGELKEVEPQYKHSFGGFVDEIVKMRENILNEMWGERNE